MGLGDEYLALKLLPEKLYLQFLSWIQCSLAVPALRGCFGCVRKASEVCGVVLLLVQASVPGIQVTTAPGQLLPLPVLWLMLFMTARGGNLSRVERELVGPQNLCNAVACSSKGPTVTCKVPCAPLSCGLLDQ